MNHIPISLFLVDAFPADLMQLKRTGVEKKRVGEKERNQDLFISKLTPGLCFDFHPVVNIYTHPISYID